VSVLVPVWDGPFRRLLFNRVGLSRVADLHPNNANNIGNFCDIKGPYVDIGTVPDVARCLKNKPLTVDAAVSNWALAEAVAFGSLGQSSPDESYLYSHQYECFSELKEPPAANISKTILLSAPTAGGKTVAFALPAIELAIEKKDNQDIFNGPAAIIIYPQKALAADQFLSLIDILIPLNRNRIANNERPITIGIWDGDTKKDISKMGGEGAVVRNAKAPSTQGTNYEDIVLDQNGIPWSKNSKEPFSWILCTRDKIIEQKADILLSNPQALEHLLHSVNSSKVLGAERKRQIDLIVFDEVHTLRGWMATKQRFFIERLRNSSLTPSHLLLSSATVGNKLEFASLISSVSENDIICIDAKPMQLDLIKSDGVITIDNSLPHEISSALEGGDIDGRLKKYFDSFGIELTDFDSLDNLHKRIKVFTVLINQHKGFSDILILFEEMKEGDSRLFKTIMKLSSTIENSGHSMDGEKALYHVLELMKCLGLMSDRQYHFINMKEGIAGNVESGEIIALDNVLHIPKGYSLVLTCKNCHNLYQWSIIKDGDEWHKCADPLTKQVGFVKPFKWDYEISSWKRMPRCICGASLRHNLKHPSVYYATFTSFVIEAMDDANIFDNRKQIWFSESRGSAEVLGSGMNENNSLIASRREAIRFLLANNNNLKLNEIDAHLNNTLRDNYYNDSDPLHKAMFDLGDKNPVFKEYVRFWRHAQSRFLPIPCGIMKEGARFNDYLFSNKIITLPILSSLYSNIFNLNVAHIVISSLFTDSKRYISLELLSQNKGHPGSSLKNIINNVIKTLSNGSNIDLLTNLTEEIVDQLNKSGLIEKKMDEYQQDLDDMDDWSDEFEISEDQIEHDEGYEYIIPSLIYNSLEISVCQEITLCQKCRFIALGQNARCIKCHSSEIVNGNRLSNEWDTEINYGSDHWGIELRNGLQDSTIEADLIRSAVHRAGVDGKIRSAIEESLKSPQPNSVNAVSATSTLEVGIDIGSLSLGGTVGFPRFRSSFVQRAGRVGRTGGSTSHFITICRPGDAKDSYVFRRLEKYLNGVESIHVPLDANHPANSEALTLMFSYGLRRRVTNRTFGERMNYEDIKIDVKYSARIKITWASIIRIEKETLKGLADGRFMVYIQKYHLNTDSVKYIIEGVKRLLAPSLRSDRWMFSVLEQRVIDDHILPLGQMQEQYAIGKLSNKYSYQIGKHLTNSTHKLVDLLGTLGWFSGIGDIGRNVVVMSRRGSEVELKQAHHALSEAAPGPATYQTKKMDKAISKLLKMPGLSMDDVKGEIKNILDEGFSIKNKLGRFGRYQGMRYTIEGGFGPPIDIPSSLGIEKIGFCTKCRISYKLDIGLCILCGEGISDLRIKDSKLVIEEIIDILEEGYSETSSLIEGVRTHLKTADTLIPVDRTISPMMFATAGNFNQYSRQASIVSEWIAPLNSLKQSASIEVDLGLNSSMSEYILEQVNNCDRIESNVFPQVSSTIISPFGEIVVDYHPLSSIIHYVPVTMRGESPLPSHLLTYQLDGKAIISGNPGFTFTSEAMCLKIPLDVLLKFVNDDEKRPSDLNHNKISAIHTLSNGLYSLWARDDSHGHESSELRFMFTFGDDEEVIIWYYDMAQEGTGASLSLFGRIEAYLGQNGEFWEMVKGTKCDNDCVIYCSNCLITEHTNSWAMRALFKSTIDDEIIAAPFIDRRSIIQ
jgi:hypothetical protein